MSCGKSLWLLVNDAGNEKSLSNSHSKCTQVRRIPSVLSSLLVCRDRHVVCNSDITSRSCKASWFPGGDPQTPNLSSSFLSAWQEKGTPPSIARKNPLTEPLASYENHLDLVSEVCVSPFSALGLMTNQN